MKIPLVEFSQRIDGHIHAPIFKIPMHFQPFSFLRSVYEMIAQIYEMRVTVHRVKPL